VEKQLRNKKNLEIQIEKLIKFSNPKNYFEQYLTDSSLASYILNLAFIDGNIESKNILDAGSGTGVFSFGSLQLGARSVTSVEIDPDQEQVLHQNLINFSNVEIIIGNVVDLRSKWDTVICNPPFGSVIKDSDMPFLESIFSLGNYVYLVHNWKARDFIVNFTSKHGKILREEKNQLIIPRTYDHHKKDYQKIDVLLLTVKTIP
jgi:putative methylase